jgi:hypothetical protein
LVTAIIHIAKISDYYSRMSAALKARFYQDEKFA